MLQTRLNNLGIFHEVETMLVSRLACRCRVFWSSPEGCQVPGANTEC